MGTTIERAALGRTARHGDLYNAFTDRFCDGLSIFNEEVPDSLLEHETISMCSSEVVITETRVERCKSLHLEKELMLSVIGLDVPVHGSAEFLAAEPDDTNFLTVALIYQKKTNAERLKFVSPECIQLISLNNIAESGATHVVVSIEWGINAVIALRFSSRNEAEKAQILFEKLANEMRASGRIEITESELPATSEVNLEFYTDMGMERCQRPTTLKDCLAFLNKIPLHLTGDRRRTRPVNYSLFPLDILQCMKGERANVRSAVKSLDDSTVEITLLFLEKLAKYRRRASGQAEAIKTRSSAFNPSTCDEICKNWASCKEKFDSFRSVSRESIGSFRSGQSASVAEVVKSGEAFLVQEDLFLTKFDFVNKKVDYIARIEARKGYFTADPQQLREKLLHGKHYVFFANLAKMDGKFPHCSFLFEKLCSFWEKNCVLYDLNVNALEGITENSISLYSEGCCVEDDVLRFSGLLQEYNLVRFDSMPKASAKKPFQRARAKVSCPKSLCSNGCSKQKREWACYSCVKTIEYGFNGCFYCDCGESDAFSTLWCCQDPVHGKEYTKFSKQMLLDQLNEIEHCNEYNVLVLGETGSGKSTWINSIANYLLFESLDAALQHPLKYLIPTSFSIEIDKTEVRKIQVGQSADETFADGQSATKKPKSYSFLYNDSLIRLIDTPGVCDTRGHEEDKKNVDLILRELQSVSELHAICLLLPPDSSRLTVAFQYCINELLANLHKSAAKNIIFCFTKSRQTHYGAGQTLTILEECLRGLKQLRKVDIVLSKDTMFYFENEAFRLLCAAKNNVTFGDKKKKAYEESWKVSAAETQRFLQSVLKLPPHKTREMISLNEARRIIGTLTQPLAEIANNIDTNLRLANEAKEECQHLDEVTADLESRLSTMGGVTLEAVPIRYARTVCGSAKCIETKSLPGTNVTRVYYKTICHGRCNWICMMQPFLPWIWALPCCAMKMNGLKRECRHCGCPWNLHLRIRYLQELKKNPVTDEETKMLLKLNQEKERRIEKKDVLDAYDRQIALLKKQKERITEICLKFGAFLDRNSIILHNDTLIQHLKHAIKLEKQVAGITEDNRKVESLRRHLDEYTRELNILKSNLSSGKEKIDVEDILNLKQELYSMKFDCCNIAQYLQVLDDANERDFKREETYFEADEHVVNKRKNEYPKKQWKSIQREIPKKVSVVNC